LKSQSRAGQTSREIVGSADCWIGVAATFQSLGQSSGNLSVRVGVAIRRGRQPRHLQPLSKSDPLNLNQTCSAIRRLDRQSVSRSIPLTMMLMHQFAFPAFAVQLQHVAASLCCEWAI